MIWYYCIVLIFSSGVRGETTTEVDENRQDVETTIASVSIIPGAGASFVSGSTPSSPELTFPISLFSTSLPFGSEIHDLSSKLYDEVCRTMNGNQSVSYVETEGEFKLSCSFYCVVNGTMKNIPFPKLDLTSCGENMVCSQGLCRHLADTKEIENCKEAYPDTEMTAFMSEMPCMVDCHPINTTIFYSLPSEDGLPCQYNIPFFSPLVGRCQSGICRPNMV